MSKWNRSAMRVIFLTAGACLGGLILKNIWPQIILPNFSLTVYAVILVLAHMASPVVENAKDMGFDWLISLTSLTVLPACAGVLEVPLWKAALVDGLFSGAVILALDCMGRRAKLRRTDNKAMWINGLLLILAVQGFDHMLH